MIENKNIRKTKKKVAHLIDNFISIMLKGSSEYNQRQSIAGLSERINISKPKKLSPEKKISFPK